MSDHAPADFVLRRRSPDGTLTTWACLSHLELVADHLYDVPLHGAAVEVLDIRPKADPSIPWVLLDLSHGAPMLF